MRKYIIGIVVGVLLSSAVFVLAGNVDSPAAPGATNSFTLEDIWNRLDSGADGAQSTFTEPGVPPGTGTMHTLNDIMNQAPAKDDVNGTTTANVVAGQTFWGLNVAGGQWGPQTGAMPNNGAVTITPTTTNQAIAVGYHNGLGYCEGDADLATDNIKDGVDIFGVTGTLAGGAGVPRTGQTKCYTDTHPSEVNCPAAGWPGQDGDHLKDVAWPNPRFTKHGDGTVTDNLTGLMWMQDANAGDDCDGVDTGPQTWAEALDSAAACNTNTFAGYTDWRLPNVREMQSLVHYGFAGRAVPDTAGTGQWAAGDPFDNVLSSRYWSSTTYVVTTSSAWNVNLLNGTVGNANKTTTYYVWPVRGGQ